MADGTNNAQANQQPPEPSSELKSLGERLVGTWEMSGEVQGTVTYEWMEGGFFLIQHVDLEQYGQRIKGIEIIGHARPFGAAPSEEIKSRFYSNTGDTLDYVYELEGNTLTIWGGERVPRRMPRVNLARMSRQVRASGCIRVVAVISSP